MSSLTDPITFRLSTLVAEPRGMTDQEAILFLTTGEEPDLSKPPVPLAAEIPDDAQVLTDADALRVLSGEAILTAAGFDPGQLRDADGRWIDSPGGGGDAGLVRGVAEPLTKDEITTRGKKMDGILHAARRLATDRVHATRLPGKKTLVWSPERDQIHRDIVNAVYARAQNVPNDGKAIIMGGPMGAGKTTVLREHAGVNPGDYLIISPDDMKDELASRGLVPQVPGHPELSPLELSTLIHQESMRLADMLARRAYQDGKNVIWDVSMASPRGPRSQINAMDDAGYKRISAIVVDVSPRTSRRRAYARYGEGLNDWRTGKGNGGRYIPRDRLNFQHDSKGRSYSRLTLADMQDEFDAWVIYDNDVDGAPPKLVRNMGEIK